ncbi:MAG: OsmC family protein [Cytophagales bacterium]|nr:OsmC family protein [Cytophagales bacterium]
MDHHYKANLIWTGNKGQGTSGYQAYERSYQIQIDGKPSIAGSSDPAFLGDPTKSNPEDLLLAAVSSCHMLWYLHLCAVNGIVVVNYLDRAEGTMKLNEDGSGAFTSLKLHPEVVVSEERMIPKAEELHSEANRKCFIANTLNIKVWHAANITVAQS